MTNRISCAIVALLLSPSIMIPSTIRAEEQPLVRTTSSQIAIKNLNYLIQRAELRVRSAPHNPAVVADYLEVLLMRASFLNTFNDFDRALQVTQELIRGRPNDPRALLQSARVMQKLHRFSAALSLLDKAAAIALESPVEQQPGFQRQLDLQYIIIKLARNNTDQALSLLKRLKASSKGAAGAADLAVLFAAVYRSQGLLEAADAKLAESLEHWDRITPFTVAWVSFQRGELWVGVDDARAETRYEEALHYLPEYVTPRVHLAELKKRGGDIDAAIKLLKPIAEDQDPEPAGRLAEFLEAAGENKQSLLYREIALRGWELLLTRYPLTFADHAAEFWLAAGANPELALEWAAKNYKNQPTSRAKTLLLEATLATENLE